jgi:glucokinase
MILAGDIGGTNTRLALYENNKLIGEEKKFPSRNYQNLETIIEEFLQGKKVERACFGIAGAVQNGVCKATNLPWIVDVKNISQKINIPHVYLLNDLEAHAYGIHELKKDELFELQKGIVKKGNQALIAAGTGLGEAGLFFNGKNHIPFASEGGHTDFAPRDEEEIELFKFLHKKFPHVSYERILSGPGLFSVWEFLTQTKNYKVPSDLKKALETQPGPKAIGEWALEHNDPGCLKAIDLFLSIYGAEAGNVALKFLSVGGLYIGGGIAPKLLKFIKTGRFLNSFLEKGRFKALLSEIPVYVILNDDTAILGAHYFAKNA